MTINALLMDPADNVVTCVTEVHKGEEIVFKRNDEVCTLTAAEDIPYCHKAALADLHKGDHVRFFDLAGIAVIVFKQVRLDVQRLKLQFCETPVFD